MSGEISDDIKSTIWYIIPGFIFIFPFISEFESGDLAGVIFLSWIVGFFIHQIYRLFYEYCILITKPILKDYKRELERLYREPVTLRQADCYYEFRYWYACEKAFKGIRALGVFEASMGSIWTALFLNLFTVAIGLLLDLIPTGLISAGEMTFTICLMIIISVFWGLIHKILNIKEKEFYKYKTWVESQQNNKPPELK